MKRFRVFICLSFLITVLPGTAGAQTKHHTTALGTLRTRLTIERHAYQRNHSAVRWFLNHRTQGPLAAKLAAPTLVVTRTVSNAGFGARKPIGFVIAVVRPSICHALGVITPITICEHAQAQAAIKTQIAQTKQAIHHARQLLTMTIPETNDWVTAVRVMQRAYPGSSGWLLSCSASEGGHGGFVMNTLGSGAGGNMQYMSGTFWGDYGHATADLRSRGYIIPASSASWSSPLGQAIAAGWAYFHSRPYGKWTGSGC